MFIWPPLRMRCLHIVHIPLWVLSQINFLQIWQKSHPKYHQQAPPVWHPSSFNFPGESSSRYLPHSSLCNVLSILCGCSHAHFLPHHNSRDPYRQQHIKASTPGLLISFHPASYLEAGPIKSFSSQIISHNQHEKTTGHSIKSLDVVLLPGGLGMCR